MTSIVGDQAETGTSIAVVRSGMPPDAANAGQPRLARIHTRLADGVVAHVLPLLVSAYGGAARVASGAGSTDAADRLAAAIYASDVVVALAAEGELYAADTRVAASALADVCDEPFAVAALDLYLRAISSSRLLELPPVVAAELQIRLLLHLDVAVEASVWQRIGGAQVHCVISLGADASSRRIRASAKGAITGKSGLSLVSRSNLRVAQVKRFGAPAGAVVIRVYGDPRRDVSAYVDAAASALAPILEREHLLAHDAAREHALVAAGEKRLLRLGFDLHDGPVQDVLALAGETRRLRDQIYPFVLETHRELARGRFDDMLARLNDIDRQMRDLADSLETKSVVSRPLSEIIHREIDAFAARTGIAARVRFAATPIR